MLRTSKMFISAVLAVAGLATGATTAAAQSQEGLVNVALEDVTVQVPVSIAANVCDLNVVALGELQDDGAVCIATSDAAASSGASSPDRPTRQEGLVNVLVDDVVVQVPVAVAANICDVNVAILGSVLDDSTACMAASDSDARAGGGGGGNTAANAAAFEPVEIVPDIGLTLLDNDPTTTTGIPIVSG
jgi:hypothetical protein